MQSLKSDLEYILYIYVSIDEVLKMAIAELNNIDSRLTEIYSNQVTSNVSNDTEDRGNLLLQQMQLIAINNKNFLNIR